MSDFRCGTKAGPGEVLEISTWGGGRLGGYKRVVGEVPRACVEALGINCSALDDLDARGEPNGAVWYDAAQAKRLRAHKHWRTVEPTQ